MGFDILIIGSGVVGSALAIKNFSIRLQSGYSRFERNFS